MVLHLKFKLIIIKNNYNRTKNLGNIFEYSVKVNRYSVITIEYHQVKFDQQHQILINKIRILGLHELR